MPMDLKWTTPLRNGKSRALVMMVELALKRHGKITIGTNNVDVMFKCLIDAFPNTNITKGRLCVSVENKK